MGDWSPAWAAPEEAPWAAAWGLAAGAGGGGGGASEGVAYRSIASTTYASRTNTTVNKPAGTVYGDVLVMMALTGGSPTAPALTPPAGWVEFTGYPQTVSDGSFQIVSHLYWRRASNEPASYTFTHAAGASQAAVIAISGASSTVDPQASVDNGQGTTLTAPGISTVAANALVGIIAHNWELWGSTTPPAGFTARLDAADSLIFVGDCIKVAPGATGATSMDAHNSQAYHPWAASLIGVEPEVAAGSIPAITSANLAAGAITISGTGFGAAPGTPLLWDDFEAGTDGADAVSPAIGTWNVLGYAKYTTAQKHGGTKSLYSLHTPAAQWGNFEVALPAGDRFLQSFWFRYNYPAAGTGQSKLSQIHGSAGQGDFAPGVMTGGLAGDWWASYISTESGTDDLATRSNYPAEPTQNAWHHFELVLEQSTPDTADGRVIVRIDGVVVYQMLGVVTRETAARWNLAEFFAGLTNFDSNSETWLDECYLADSWARVELGDASTYSACTKRSIQPIDSWSASAIGATLNAGEFAGATAYLYVTNADGEVNANGYAVAIP